MIRVALVALLLVAAEAAAGTPRDPATVRAFRATHPCPLTGKTTGPCNGWVVDHMYPLCAGGTDTVDNMQWQTRTMSFSKDRVERELCACKRR